MNIMTNIHRSLTVAARRGSRATTIIAALAITATPGVGAVTHYTSFTAWHLHAGVYDRIDFTGHPTLTIITTQYQDMGVTFTDGDDIILSGDQRTFPLDGSGLATLGPQQITVVFDEPQYWVGVHHAQFVKLTLYWKGRIIHASPTKGLPVPGNFSGSVSSEPFDAVVLSTLTGPVLIDDLYFGHEPLPPCPDLTGDWQVNGLDLSMLLGFWSTPAGSACTPISCAADFNKDGTVNGQDLARLLGQWGPCHE